MNRIFGTHPALPAFLLGGGAFLFSYFGWKVFFPPPEIVQEYTNTDIVEVSYWILFIIGAASWLAGGILFGLNRGMHWLSSLALHLIPVVGLILMALLRRNLTPHEAWSRSHRGQVNEASLRRNYRQMKSLY